ncbi:MAG: hypothetical protein [Microvirus sp.]|nr:MAG: hypothetical protein [Microvirus sp.]
MKKRIHVHRFKVRERVPSRSVLDLQLRATLRRAQLGASLPVPYKAPSKPVRLGSSKLEVQKRAKTSVLEHHVVQGASSPQSRRFPVLGPSVVMMSNRQLSKIAGVAFAPHKVAQLHAGSAALEARLSMVASKAQMQLWRQDRKAALAKIATRPVNCIPVPKPGLGGGAASGTRRPRRFIPFC